MLRQVAMLKPLVLMSSPGNEQNTVIDYCECQAHIHAHTGLEDRIDFSYCALSLG